MIVVKLTGGLGNQMFQYSAGRALAYKHHTQLLLDVRFFEKQSLREFSLDRFLIQASVATANDLHPWPSWSRKPSAWLQRLGISTNRYKQPTFSFDPCWDVVSDNTMIEGYFQSEKYFSQIKSILRQEFLPRSMPSGANRDFEMLITSTESVMIHIRRGDYVSNPKALKTHGLCSLSYYENAMEQIYSKVKDPHFFIFSDDLDWVTDNLRLRGDVAYVSGNISLPEIDLYLMSRCKHFVLANSSFSWWAAWLGGDEKSICISPSPWFDKPSFDESDLIPTMWIKMKKYSMIN